MSEIEILAYEYGRAVAHRENEESGDHHAFEALDELCRRLWQQLIEAGAYTDAGNSQLKPEVREHYLRGLESVPPRPMDWEEYWEIIDEDE